MSIVEYKVQQTHFFLERVRHANLNFFAAQCYVDAFVSSARSITFSMQAVMASVPGFSEWYIVQQRKLKEDPISGFFNQYRKISIHIGDTVVRSGSWARDDSGRRVTRYYFKPIPDIPAVPDQDIVTICSYHFKNCLELVFGAVMTFKHQLDDRWYFTQEYFRQMGKTADDAEEELGLPRGWTAIGDVYSTPERWAVLRRSHTVGCQLNHLFELYLEKVIFGPDDFPGQPASPHAEPTTPIPQG